MRGVMIWHSLNTRIPNSRSSGGLFQECSAYPAKSLVRVARTISIAATDIEDSRRKNRYNCETRLRVARTHPKRVVGAGHPAQRTPARGGGPGLWEQRDSRSR